MKSSRSPTGRDRLGQKHMAQSEMASKIGRRNRPLPKLSEIILIFEEKD